MHELFPAAPVLSVPAVILLLDNENDRQFVSDIYLQHRRLMYAVSSRYFHGRREDIEDAISASAEMMCRYVTHLRAVRPEKMKSYVLAITGNVCRRKLASSDSGRRIFLSDEGWSTVQDPVDHYVSVFDYADAVDLLASFDGLSEKEKDLIRLRHIDRTEISDIAEMLSMSEASVRTAISRVKQHLCALAASRKEIV